MDKKLISRVVLEVIDPIEAEFWLKIWLGHHQEALEDVFGQNQLPT